LQNKLIKEEQMIELNCRVRDKITKFEGTVIAITHWLNGCTRAGVQSRELKDGIPTDPQWFDLTQLELVDACGAEPKEEKEEEKPGGPRNDPTIDMVGK
jgi:hypothetical protein